MTSLIKQITQDLIKLIVLLLEDRLLHNLIHLIKLVVPVLCLIKQKNSLEKQE